MSFGGSVFFIVNLLFGSDISSRCCDDKLGQTSPFNVPDMALLLYKRLLIFLKLLPNIIISFSFAFSCNTCVSLLFFSGLLRLTFMDLVPVFGWM